MSLIKKFGIKLFILVLFLTSFAVVRAYYIPTGRDTLPPPESFTYDILDPTGLELLYSTTNFDYYFRESLDTIVIYDNRNGYTWKTGTDIEFSKRIDDDCDDMIDRFEDEDPLDVITDGMILEACQPKEIRLNTTYTGFANSLITIEYFDDANNIKRTSSASYKDVSSSLMSENSDNSHYRLDIDFEDLLIQISVHIYFDDEGIRYEVRDSEVSGFGIDRLSAIIIAPFTGASGGAYEEFSLEEMDYSDDEIFKERIPGYTLVPDGSGSLIRFNDNAVKLQPYKSTIYGLDPSQDVNYHSTATGYVPFKTASMPVFGIAHGNLQAAFVAFATNGEEYMQIVAMPEDNLTYYNFTYPRFEYNKKYFQVYNKSGWGYFTNYDERNHFDIDMRYNFLAGTGDTGYQADYVGMALSYRHHLMNEGVLQEVNSTDTEIPIRLDFFMSDVEKGITGYNNQVTTTVGNVRKILNMITSNLNISNINSGLLGWNDGGITLGDPRDTDFTREIGRKSAFKDLIKDFGKEGIDISLSQDYYYINEEIMSLRKNAAKHTSTWYSRIETFNYPISMFYYARPVKSVSWMQDQAKVFDGLGVSSYTVLGITNHLISDYTTEMSREESKAVIREGFSDLNQDQLVNAYQPNMYLWEYVDRYLNTPVYGSQFLVETDTVPFLEIVLANTMEMYAPYSNFSFYTTSDVLRMIDYNIYPSFVLTYEPAYLLSDTNSRNFYSTEYDLYEELIDSIYYTVDDALSSVIGINWVNRVVAENGVIVNTYENGVEIVINYTEDEITYNGETLEPLSYLVIGGGN